MDGIQRLQTHKRLHKHTHTHMFKVTLIGWGRLTWRSHYEGLSGVDWCVGHSFEMPCVALIKITNEKIHNTPSVAWNYSLYCCNGRDFISFFFFDNTAIELNWNDIKWNHVFFNWYWNIPGNKNYEIRLQITWFLYENIIILGVLNVLFVSDLGINFRLLCMYVQLILLINILSCVEEGDFKVIWGLAKSIRQSFLSPEIRSPCLSGFGPLIAAVCSVWYSKRFECITYSWLGILERNNERTEYYSCRQMT